jgi:excisionase family DNA binding protein
MPRFYSPREAAAVLGISYASLKQWIYQGKLKSVQTPGGHHRISESEIDRLLPRKTVVDTPEMKRRMSRRVSGRNQLIGRITDIKVSGLVA